MNNKTIELHENQVVRPIRRLAFSGLTYCLAVAGLGGLLYIGGRVGYREAQDIATTVKRRIAIDYLEALEDIDIEIRWDAKKNDFEVKTLRDLDKSELKQALGLAISKLEQREASLVEIKRYVELETTGITPEPQE